MASESTRVSESNTNHHHEMSTESLSTVNGSKLICETVSGSHEFEIQGYSLAKGMGVGKGMASSKFTVGGHDWVIMFYPDGQTQDSKEYVSAFVHLVSPGHVRASYELELLDQSGKEIHKRCSNSVVTFGTNFDMWGLKKFLKRSEFEDSRFLKDDCLSFYCTVRVVQTRVEEKKRYFIHVPPSDLIQNLKDSLESEITTDITLQVGNESFRAHKSILAARSPVFEAQFFGQVGNPNMDTSVIEDLDPFAFKALLLYLYSDEFPEARELSDSDSSCTRITIMQHLLAAADLYILPRLKGMCEEKLCEEMTANTVASTLALAKRYGCKQLKTVCLDFAAKPENLGDVMKSDGYSDLDKSLLTELLKTCSLVDKK